jgi:hypothetical protein
MAEDSLRGLFALWGDLEEGQEDGRGLCLRERGMVQRGRAQGMVPGIGRTREDQTHGLGQEGRRCRALTAEVILPRLEIVFAIPPGTIEVCVGLCRTVCLGGRAGAVAPVCEGA